MSDVFISYARVDRPRAAALAAALEARGWSVWWDRNIPPGARFRDVIEEEIRSAGCVLVLWSAQSVKGSDWVIDEATEAKDRNVLLPVLIEEVKQPFGFRQIQAADMTDWSGEASAPAFRLLQGRIEALIGDAAVVTQPSPRDGYVRIPPGEFWMGATPDDTESYRGEKPRHRVRIAKGFRMSETPVTVAEFKRFAQAMPPAPDFNPSWTKEDHPIVNVTWDQAKAYCEWAGGRLPTEAEWEYAARGGKDGLKYPWGNEIAPANANYSGSQWKGTSPVRSYPPNAWGLYDMAGNVWEWVADWYGEDYYATLSQDKTTDDPRGPQSGGKRVLRGGSFLSDTSLLRAAYRLRYAPGFRNFIVGFRCVRKV